MHGCQQTPGQTIYQHGRSVHDWYLDLYRHLTEGRPLERSWRLPEWINDPRIVAQLLPLSVMREYHWYHDCGKPFCRVLDDQDRQHFPDHARISADLYRRAGGSEQIARLIEMDMDIHMLRSDDVPEFARRPEWASLLITGLCEIHANCEMFGGTGSDSFKIKWKRLNQRGKTILKEYEACHR